eukprot:CAMPEP_0174820424 /NCGR_PEP_ID=MMETSP1107-20130205/4253_1 /TAXON_ID=36770 /ORGANISM="Paraphysomonas vestita, Strain GFlagA" /LENGTH=127 /DNA_ID=CAMNT_0016035737 /DNA_START=1 /DNA_END=382 /DNA_ORIENTATION=-
MNFQEDGGYTMELLNWKYGPEIFWAMCFLVILVNMYFFYTTGLLTWKENEGILSTDGPRWMSRESETSEDFEEGSIDYRKESLLDGHSKQVLLMKDLYKKNLEEFQKQNQEEQLMQEDMLKINIVHI